MTMETGRWAKDPQAPEWQGAAEVDWDGGHVGSNPTGTDCQRLLPVSWPFARPSTTVQCGVGGWHHCPPSSRMGMHTQSIISLAENKIMQ